jgi:hypothetical protein
LTNEPNVAMCFFQIFIGLHPCYFAFFIPVWRPMRPVFDQICVQRVAQVEENSADVSCFDIRLKLKVGVLSVLIQKRHFQIEWLWDF